MTGESTSWAVRCTDLAGRARTAVVRARPEWTVTLQLPPGGAGWFAVDDVEGLRAALRQARAALPLLGGLR